MSRSGYIDGGIDDPLVLGRWRGQVRSAIRGKRGQAFLKELAAAMDAMPEKILAADALIDDDGTPCAIGVVCQARGIDVSKIDYYDPEAVGNAVNIARQMAAEIEYENDEEGFRFERDPKTGNNWMRVDETPAERWKRMRLWVQLNIRSEEDSK